MNREKDVALESLDRGFEESKNMQLMLFLNDQAEISNRLKTCRFKENSNNSGVPYSPDARVSTAPEAATRTHRLRPLSARPSTASGRQYQEPEESQKIDFDNLSVSGRRSSAVRRQTTTESSSSSAPTPSSSNQRPETVCGFYDLTDVEEESDIDLYDAESDLDVLSIESITSTSPCDDIDEDEEDGLTYEFDVPESDQRHIEAESRDESESHTVVIPSAPPRRDMRRRHTSSDTISSQTPTSSPTRAKSSKTRKSMPNIAPSSNNKTVIKTYPTPHPPNRVGYEPSSVPESSSTTTVLKHMRTRLSSTDLKDRGRVHSFSKGVVWGDPNENGSSSSPSSNHFRSPSDRSPLAAAQMSPRISFEEIPIEKQGVSLRTVARIDCDASFYRKLRHRSAPAMRTDDLMTSRSEGNSPVRAKPIGIYHLPPLTKETSSTSPAHSGARTLAPAEFLAHQVPQHKTVFQEQNLLH